MGDGQFGIIFFYSVEQMGYDVLRGYAEKSGMPLGALKEVYDRGIGAWKTNPASVRSTSGVKTGVATHIGKMPKEQWALARVKAFINKKKTVFYGADDYIRRKYHLS